MAHLFSWQYFSQWIQRISTIVDRYLTWEPFLLNIETTVTDEPPLLVSLNNPVTILLGPANLAPRLLEYKISRRIELTGQIRIQSNTSGGIEFLLYIPSALTPQYLTNEWVISGIVSVHAGEENIESGTGSISINTSHPVFYDVEMLPHPDTGRFVPSIGVSFVANTAGTFSVHYMITITSSL